ncbi:dipeptide transport system permease [Actinobacillus equuli]|nr:dipeptide transport system permease [Actinobacillus equuli]
MVIPTFLAITLITFALVHLIPGDPIEIRMGERGLDPAVHAQMMAQLGLDLPLHEQYLIILKGYFRAISAIHSVITNRC